MITSLITKSPHYSNGHLYNPKTEYTFVSYYAISGCKWVRSPFLKYAELMDAMENLPFLMTPSLLPSNNSKLPGFLPDYKNLQVFSESWLSELRQDWDEANQTYVDSEYTNRQLLFDDRYEQSAVHFTGVPSLSRQTGEDKDVWIQRVAAHRSALKAESLENMVLIASLSDQQQELRRLFELYLTE